MWTLSFQLTFLLPGVSVSTFPASLMSSPVYPQPITSQPSGATTPYSVLWTVSYQCQYVSCHCQCLHKLHFHPSLVLSQPVYSVYCPPLAGIPCVYSPVTAGIPYTVYIVYTAISPNALICSQCLWYRSPVYPTYCAVNTRYTVLSSPVYPTYCVSHLTVPKSGFLSLWPWLLCSPADWPTTQ